MFTPFDISMIAAHLEARGIEHDIDDDGDYRFAIAIEGTDDASDSGSPITMAVFIGAEGTNDDILSIRAIAMATIPPEALMPVMSACNQWNVERRYPKAGLVVSRAADASPSDTPESGQVHLMCHYPLGAGATQVLVDDLISETLGGSIEYWQWMPGWLAQMAEQHAPTDLQRGSLFN
jgi:hypothetical protein